jgi:hypothetical protein
MSEHGFRKSWRKLAFRCLFAGLVLPLVLAASPRTLRISASGLAESSGLAASRARPGVWFTHNDSGHEPEIYAFNLNGELLGVHRVEGAGCRDWEDIAAGPCPEGVGGPRDCLYVGDIGDNRRERPYVTIYVVPEPVGTDPVRVLGSWVVRYPGAPRNAETLLFDPRERRLLVVTKEKDGRSRLYRLPPDPVPQVEGMDPPEAVLLEDLGALDFDGHDASDRSATGGDINVEGTRMLIRTYTRLCLWTREPSSAAPIWEGRPLCRRFTAEAQGEGVAFGLDGRLVTSSEGDPMPVTLHPPF